MRDYAAWSMVCRYPAGWCRVPSAGRSETRRAVPVAVVVVSRPGVGVNDRPRLGRGVMLRNAAEGLVAGHPSPVANGPRALRLHGGARSAAGAVRGRDYFADDGEKVTNDHGPCGFVTSLPLSVVNATNPRRVPEFGAKLTLNRGSGMAEEDGGMAEEDGGWRRRMGGWRMGDGGSRTGYARVALYRSTPGSLGSPAGHNRGGDPGCAFPEGDPAVVVAAVAVGDVIRERAGDAPVASWPRSKLISGPSNGAAS